MEGLVRSQMRGKELTLSGDNEKCLGYFRVLGPSEGKRSLRMIHHYGAGALVSCK